MVLLNISDGSNTFSMCTDSDDGLSLQTLQTGFPNAVNLLNPDYEPRKVLLSIRNGSIFNPFGWDPNIVYLVHNGSRPPTPIDRDYTRNFELVKPFLFYINEETGFKSCAVALTKNFLVSYRHGTHSSYVKDSTVVDIVSILSQEQYKATVFYISDKQDYVILKTEEKVVYRDAPIELCDVMKKFVVCGYAKGFLESTFVHGTVYSTVPVAYECNSRQFGPFIYGTAKTSTSDSGAACFGKSGLMAINLGITVMPKTFHDDAISEAAIFSPNNYMVPANTILEKLATLQPKKSAKRPHREVHIEGMGKFAF